MKAIHRPRVTSAIIVYGGRYQHAGELNAVTGAILPLCHRPIKAPLVIGRNDDGTFRSGLVTCYVCLVRLGVVEQRGRPPIKPRPLCHCGKPVRRTRRKHCSPACQYEMLRGRVYSNSPAAIVKRAQRNRRRSRQ